MPFVPTEPGYYWATPVDGREMIDRHEMIVVEVVRYPEDGGGHEVQCPGTDEAYKLDYFRFLTGPLQPPTIDDPPGE